MKKVLSKSNAARGAIVAAVVAPVLYLVGGVAGATGTPSALVTSGFTSAQSSLTTYLGLGIVLFLAIFVASVAVLMLKKWGKRGATSG